MNIPILAEAWKVLSGKLPGIDRYARRTAWTARLLFVASIVVLPMVALPLFESSSALSSAPSTLYTSETGSAVAARIARKFVSSGAKTGKASVSTDKSDYAPGERVITTGRGWKPGETVKLIIHRNNRAADEVLNARADATGKFINQELIIKRSDLGVAFVLTAQGLTSKYTAEVMFTDANVTVSSQMVVPQQITRTAFRRSR